jgi:peptidyl-prolyl cis-trans isomerase D
MALRLFREWMKYLKWILWLIVAAFIFALFFDFGSIQQFGRNTSQVAVSVGDQEITYDEFRRQHSQLDSRYRQMFGERYTDEVAKQFNLPQQAIDQLISRRILLMEAERIGLKATDAEVQDAILSIPTFKDANGKFIGREAVLNILTANQLTQDRFAAMMREDVLIEKLENVLAQTAYLPESQLEAAFRDRNERAKIRYVQLPGSEAARGGVTVADADLQAYFLAHGNEFRLGEQRIVDIALVDTQKLRQSMTIDDAELRSYYDSHASEFETKEQVRARHILLRTKPERDDAATRQAAEGVLARLRGGEDFAKLAAELSDDESNNTKGGDLGYFGRGQMVKAFEDAAFGAQPGSAIGPVKTDFGYHLIEVLDRRAGGSQPFEQVKAIISARLSNERITQLAEAKAKELRGKLANVKTTDEMKKIAEQEGAAFETTAAFGREDVVANYGRVRDLNDAAFKLAAGGVSEPVRTPRGWAVLRLQKINEPRLPELGEVRDKVRQAVEREKQRQAAVARLQQARGQVAAGQADLDKVAAELGLQVTESSEFGRFDTISGLTDAQPVIDAALALEAGALSQPVQTEVGAVLFQVLERKKFSKSEFDAQREEIRKSEEEKRVGQMRTALIELRRRDYAPQVDAQLVEQYGLQGATPGRG